MQSAGLSDETDADLQGTKALRDVTEPIQVREGSLDELKDH